MSYSEERKQYLSCLSQRIGKPVTELVPWVDYSPIACDEAAFNASQSRSGVVFCGD